MDWFVQNKMRSLNGTNRHHIFIHNAQCYKADIELSNSITALLIQSAPRYLTDSTVCLCLKFLVAYLICQTSSLSVPRVRRRTFGSRDFSVAGPTVWNSLPEFCVLHQSTPQTFSAGLPNTSIHRTLRSVAHERCLRGRGLKNQHLFIYLLTY